MSTSTPEQRVNAQAFTPSGLTVEELYNLAKDTPEGRAKFEADGVHTFADYLRKCGEVSELKNRDVQRDAEKRWHEAALARWNEVDAELRSKA
jgi:hypothetical protein